MAGDKAKAIPLLEWMGAADRVPGAARLRVALDVLEPIAAGTVAAPVSPRKSGSRHDVANVFVGVRGKAKLVGRGNRSGIQVLLWEILAGRPAPEKNAPPLAALVDDIEPEVAELVDASMAGRADLQDARALLKALVIASAGSVATNREVAKLAPQVAGTSEQAPAAPEASKANSTILPPPPPTAGEAGATLADLASGALTKSLAELAPSPEPPPPAIDDYDDPMAAELDAVLSEELDRIAPNGWDGWHLSAPPDPAQVPPARIEDTEAEAARQLTRAYAQAQAPAQAAANPRDSIYDPETLEGDDLLVVDEAPESPGIKRAPPPLPPRILADVVMIEADALTAAHLAGMLRRAGYAVDVCDTAKTGVARACAAQPRCVVCDEEFLGTPGATVANDARTASPRACLSPFIFLVPRSGAADSSRSRAGARDVWLEKPISTDALLEHVARFAGPVKAKADSSMLPPVGETAMDGNLSLISLRTLVSMLELERKSGVLHVTSKEREAQISFREGRVTRTHVLGRAMRAADALETLLSWEGGRFTFKPAADIAADRWASPDLARGST